LLIGHSTPSPEMPVEAMDLLLFKPNVQLYADNVSDIHRIQPSRQIMELQASTGSFSPYHKHHTQLQPGVDADK
jgi:hypothetical protein